jgi:hypothetical protein
LCDKICSKILDLCGTKKHTYKFTFSFFTLRKIIVHKFRPKLIHQIDIQLEPLSDGDDDDHLLSGPGQLEPRLVTGADAGPDGDADADCDAGSELSNGNLLRRAGADGKDAHGDRSSWADLHEPLSDSEEPEVSVDPAFPEADRISEESVDKSPADLS